MKALLASLILCAPIHAQELPTIDYPTGIPFAVMVDSQWPKAVHIPQFDASLGQLHRVEIVFQAVVRGEWFGEYLGSGGSHDDALSWDLHAEFTIQRTGAPFPYATLHHSLRETSGLLPAFDGSVDYTGPSGYFVEWSTRSRTGYVETPEPVDHRLSPWVGSGNVELLVDSPNINSLLTISCNGSCIIGSRTDLGVRVLVRYIYSPTTEK